MSKFPASAVSVTLGGVEIKGAIINGIDVNTMSEMVESTALGDANRRRLPAGLGDAEVSQIEGYYDDTPTTGQHAVLSTLDTDPNGTPKPLVVAFGGTGGTITVNVWLSQYRTLAAPGDLQRFQSNMTVDDGYTWT